MLLIIRTSLSVEDTTLREEVYHNSLCVILTGVLKALLGQVYSPTGEPVTLIRTGTRCAVGSGHSGQPTPADRAHNLVYWVIDRIAKVGLRSRQPTSVVGCHTQGEPFGCN